MNIQISLKFLKNSFFNFNQTFAKIVSEFCTPLTSYCVISAKFLDIIKKIPKTETETELGRTLIYFDDERSFLHLAFNLKCFKKMLITEKEPFMLLTLAVKPDFLISRFFIARRTVLP
jgi:hypothetical protein